MARDDWATTSTSHLQALLLAQGMPFAIRFTTALFLLAQYAMLLNAPPSVLMLFLQRNLLSSSISGVS